MVSGVSIVSLEIVLLVSGFTLPITAVYRRYDNDVKRGTAIPGWATLESLSGPATYCFPIAGMLASMANQEEIYER